MTTTPERPTGQRVYHSDATLTLLLGDAVEQMRTLPDGLVDCVVTSPPYWRKRDYGVPGQIGQERTPQAFTAAVAAVLVEARRVLAPHGSAWINVGDTYHRGSLVNIPALVEAAAVAQGWLVRNRIVWAKTGGMPEPARDRLANRHEVVLHLTRSRRYYYDLHGHATLRGNGANPGDVWHISPVKGTSAHLAPFPEDLVRRALELTCPPRVCTTCGRPAERIVRRTALLDESRPQARRAMELAREHQLSDAHIAAIQATGISDAGKALVVQTGTGRNATEVQRLAAEAKQALGGYFREFTFARKVTTGWTDCGHDTWRQSLVLDPFSGSGTTCRVALGMGHDAIGIDLDVRGHDELTASLSTPPSLPLEA